MQAPAVADVHSGELFAVSQDAEVYAAILRFLIWLQSTSSGRAFALDAINQHHWY
jgi:hypothetical protein